MEDVFLHYRSRPSDELGSLLERTERLLEPFPLRTPPVFAPWFPSTSEKHCLPIRPAKAPPWITSVDDVLKVTPPPTGHQPCAGINEGFSTKIQGDFSKPQIDQNAKDATNQRTGGHEDKSCSLVKRSWSIFMQKGVLLQSPESPSKLFSHIVAIHRLHLRQRAKWMISQQNCRDVEEVWISLSRLIRRSRLPTCNANICRERAEICVFCDLLYSEQVGRFLKDELQLMGTISLSVHKLGIVFSM